MEPSPKFHETRDIVKTLARQHQEAIWALQQTINRLRAVLLEYFPQALVAFPKLQHHAALAVRAAAPTPRTALALTDLTSSGPVV